MASDIGCGHTRNLRKPSCLYYSIHHSKSLISPPIPEWIASEKLINMATNFYHLWESIKVSIKVKIKIKVKVSGGMQ